MRKSRIFDFTMLIFLLITASGAVWANMGTPFIWLGMFHLVWGNIGIALIEGQILSKRYGLASHRIFGLMVAANFVSAGIGALIISFVEPLGYFAGLWANPLMGTKVGIPIYWILAYFFTIFIELPFVYLAVRNSALLGEFKWKGSLKASVLVNSVSYAGLMLLYLLVGNITAVTRTHIVDASALTQGMNGHVYYVSSSDGFVHKIGLDGKGDQVVNSTIQADPTALFIKQQPKSDVWDLWVELKESKDEQIVLKSFSRKTSNLYWIGHDSGPRERKLETPNDYAVDLRPKGQRKLTASTGYSPDSGLRVEYPDGHSESFALAGYGMYGMANRPTVMQGDIIIYHLSGYILAFDPNTHRIAYLATGTSPVVTLD